MYYPALIQPDGDQFMVTFRDIPEALTGAPTVEEARAAGAAALLTAMEFYFEDRRPVPLPSRAEEGEELISLPASAWAKVLLLNEQLAQGVGNSELARRLGSTPPEVSRIADLRHATKIDTLARALSVLGVDLEVVARPRGGPLRAGAQGKGAVQAGRVEAEQSLADRGGQFDALATLLQLKAGPARQGARLVLVDRLSGVAAAAQTGASPQSISNTITRFRAGLSLARQAAAFEDGVDRSSAS